MYKELNDDELIYMVKESDDVFSILYEKYHPLLNKYAHKYHHIFKKMGYEIEDLIQIGNMVLYKTLNFYSNRSENMYYTYLNKALINAYNALYRQCNTLKYKTLNNYISYDKTVPNSHYSYLEILGKCDKSYDYTNIINFKNSLSFDEASIFELKINGYTTKEISILLNFKEQFIKNCVTIIRKQAIYM